MGTAMCLLYMEFVSIHRNLEFTEYLNTCQRQFTGTTKQSPEESGEAR